MTEHMFDSILRRELRLERVHKYIKKAIKNLNSKQLEVSDYSIIRGLYNTKSILIDKMLNYLDKYETSLSIEDRLLVALIHNILEEFNNLDSGIMGKVMVLIYKSHGVEEEAYGSSYDGGYDSY